jgi:REP element-mobilizing transposase RayT
MANTYTQLYIHIIIVVKGRQNQIAVENKSEFYKYITETVQNKDNKLIAINGGLDHIHILVSLNPKQSISDLVKDIKLSASDLINSKKWLIGKFYWQEGFAAFSVSKSKILDLIEYINNQEIHHKKKTFKEEYLGFLNKYGINYDERYIFSDN